MAVSFETTNLNTDQGRLHYTAELKADEGCESREDMLKCICEGHETPGTVKRGLEQFGQYPAPFAAVPPGMKTQFGLRICLFARSCTGCARATTGCASRGMKVLRNRRIYEWRFIETDGCAAGTNLFPFDVMARFCAHCHEHILCPI